jgi:hypothetical protein
MSPAGWLRLLRLRREKEQRDYQQQSAIHSSLGVLYARRGGINCQPPKVLATRRSHADEAVRPTIVERACQQKEQFLESRGSVSYAARDTEIATMINYSAMRKLLCVLVLVALPAAAADHRALLPRPREIHDAAG